MLRSTGDPTHAPRTRRLGAALGGRGSKRSRGVLLALGWALPLGGQLMPSL